MPDFLDVIILVMTTMTEAWEEAWQTRFFANRFGVVSYCAEGALEVLNGAREIEERRRDTYEMCLTLPDETSHEDWADLWTTSCLSWTSDLVV